MANDKLKKTILAAGRFLSLVKEDHWEYASRGNTVGAVGIVAVTDADELVLVEQHRIPLDKQSIELPAGLIGDTQELKGESALIAGQRELLEETGFTAREWKLCPSYATSGGLTDESVIFVLARGLQREDFGGGVEGESIQVHLVPLVNIDEWLDSQLAIGMAVESRVLSGLHLWRRWGAQPW